jgi:hypothetical protein
MTGNYSRKKQGLSAFMQISHSQFGYFQFMAKNTHEEINFQPRKLIRQLCVRNLLIETSLTCIKTTVYTLTTKGGVHAASYPVGTGGKAAGKRG